MNNKELKYKLVVTTSYVTICSDKAMTAQINSVSIIISKNQTDFRDNVF